MMSAVLDGEIGWEVTRDKEGHRTYMIRWQVTTTDPQDGPGIVMDCPELPVPGDAWFFGNDYDPWAYCTPEMKVTPRLVKEKNTIWDVEQVFTTKPSKRCQDQSIENPLFEPIRISGSFTRFSEEATTDKDGKPIRSSSHERIRGSVVEFDDNRPTVQIGMNLPYNSLSTFSRMINNVNDRPMWGLPKRTIMLTNASWRRNIYGTCNFYYSVDYDFEIKYDTFDRYVPDFGTKVLKEGGDKNKPGDFEPVVVKETGEKLGEVPLDGNGNMAASIDGQGKIFVQKYKEANFFTLGIPAFL